VVSKEARVTGEVVVKKGVEQRTETVSDTVRSTKVDVEDDRVATDKTTLNRKDGKSLKRSV
jgi:stress response protein YsnF